MKTLDFMQDLFGQRAGSLIEDRQTYIPSGTIERFYGYHNEPYLRLIGCRTFYASEFDYMMEWCARYDPLSTTWLRLVCLEEF